MTLEEAALAFCNEVMGWGARKSKMNPDMLMVLRDGERQSWGYTHLNTVMEAVREWMDSDQEMLMHVFPHSVAVSIWLDGCMLSDVRYFNGETDCHALLEACVLAHRKLQ